jgi:hypothetical protein
MRGEAITAPSKGSVRDVFLQASRRTGFGLASVTGQVGRALAARDLTSLMAQGVAMKAG